MRTEESGNGGNGGNGDGADKSWRDGHLSDGEGSVWEEPFSFGGWDGGGDGDGDEGRSLGGEGDRDPPAPMEVGEIRVLGPPKRKSPRRRQRHLVAGVQARHQAGTEHWRREPVKAPATRQPGNGAEMGGGGVRDEEIVGGDDFDDDEGSCNSRWSLSAEDEAQERNGAENGSRSRRTHGGDDGANSGGDDAFRERPMSAVRRPQGHDPETNSVADPGAAEDGGDGAVAAGGVPEYLEDFFDGLEKEGRGTDAPFAVSSPR